MRTAIDIKDVPVEVVAAVNEEARQRETSVNDVVIGILAARYGVDWEPSGFPYQGGSESNHWNLRIPTVLHRALRAHADAIDGTATGCVLLALTNEYGLEQLPPRRRIANGLSPDVVAEARRRHEEDGASIRSLAREMGVKRETLTRAIRS